MSHPAAPSTPDDRVEPARTFQHYEILRRADGSAWELGRGTMGITYKAFDVNLCCEVALKVVNAALLDAPNARERFVREARAAAALRHRNVASVYHLGNDGERFFYAMEFIDGETLDALVRRQGPLPVETALLLTEQAARALAAAERQGLVHRDIKPANIMVVHEDADDHMVVKVIDFGLARPVAGEGTSQGALTVGGFVGTPQFASPEQLEEQALDARSDIYSLGVTTWFLLTGKAPFTGSLATICQQHLTKLPPWERLPGGLPEPVRRMLAHTLEKDPARRPQNAVALRREIEGCLEAVRAHPVAGGGTSEKRLPMGRQPQMGEMLDGRFELIRPLGEGNRGRVFEGRDVQANGEPVTITFLPAALLPSPEEVERLNDEVRLIQAAAHPHLTRVLGYECARGATEGFLIEERVNGGTLVDLLAARGGKLTAGEALRLLGQAAAAVDHAASRRLEHLGLGVHQVRLHFYAPGLAKPREYLSAPMNAWPAWTLKINPLSTIGEHPEMKTWAGEVTLVPGVGLSETHGGGSAVPGALAIGYLHALAALAYELLGGAPDAWRRAAAPGGTFVSLSALNEEANAVFRQVFGGGSGFTHSRMFYEALVGAEGFDPATLQIRTVKKPVVVPARRSTDISRKTGVLTRSAPGASESFASGGDTAFGFSEMADIYPEGSISDRLTLLSDEPSPVGRWLLGTVALVTVFVLVVAGVWVALAQHLPRAVATPMTVGKPAPIDTPKRDDRPRSVNVPRQAIPPPLPRDTLQTPSAIPAAVATADRGIAADAAPSSAIPTPTASTRLPDQESVLPAAGVLPGGNIVSVRVKSVPSGAEIFSAGKRLGTTPLEINLPVGAHELVARYDGWPETRETLVLGEDQSTAYTEIRLMPPDLVPGNEAPVSPPQPSRPRRETPMPRRAPLPVAPAVRIDPSTDTAPSIPVPMEKPRPEREVRRALPPLTPFDPDGTLVPHESPRSPGSAPSPADE